MRTRTKRKKNIYIVSTIFVIAILAAVYAYFVGYFNNHFYFSTIINGVDASGKTVDEVNRDIEKISSSYTLNIKGRDGISDTISSQDINLKYNHSNEIKNLNTSQNPFNIFKGIFLKKQYTVALNTSYDDSLLKQRIDNLIFFHSDKIIDPVNASIKLNNNNFEVVPEVMGNKVNKDKLTKAIITSISNNSTSLNLDQANSYENPKYTSKSKEVTDAKNTIDKYMQSSITYDLRGHKEVIDSSVIGEFIAIDEELNVSLNEGKIKAYIDKLAYNYNTIGISRNFITSTGQDKRIHGGNYGWAINRSEERKAIVQAIKEGKTLNRKPVYAQTTPFLDANEIGNSYVEIDITNQQMWVYKNGNMIATGHVVTGNENTKTITPEGIYRVTYKQKDTVLKGENYAAPVTFWVPFNGGIGIHDASWRKEFGGQIYKNGGSHGCVNSPYELAQAVYENVQAGTPVVCYK
ncbi:peptidoglycan transpeptidase precursor, ErfK-YbiS-YhnG family [Hathewaya proteolytica DSM 3090]|uniref:Peptidoglycan transpeptidase, ErfK-YbiS-YhnG family n=1 Tax=Hathewaya proteolytica DSM 3090 TaxID=1121331 RepID=A0A1M6LZT3_9CLOT|nr:L,D-transpeptidase/peptidoglycan binding protein [Hathewaya proteolytica]SHJ76640.1 peptidoglycan transpeptidase precursor, ErfK-YbiS-YhnG family [Hathewaya proteolytica DSM 3090]